ncbi:TetR/AcrR family transcriptional regulator [Baekduia soli]|uniref:TetR/AcrR family transcriptional regulator n=1 Tax=Baekduia soli TaxID=496014 RepID=UPI001651F5C0|nr:TetR/AcrR family transcriptional regulator [Baekduia soli]
MADEAGPGRTRAKAGKAPAKPARPSARNGGGARRDQEVLDAATKVFHTRGYADASVQHIADELGILKGSLYHYIDSKEDLLFRLLDEAHDEVDAVLAEVQAVPDLAPLDRLHLYVTRQVDYTSRNLAKMAIYYHDVNQLSEGRLKELLRKRRQHEQFVAGLIEEAQARGEVDASVDSHLATNYLFGSMIWVYRWYKPGGKLKPAQVSTSCADFVINGLTGPR